MSLSGVRVLICYMALLLGMLAYPPVSQANTQEFNVVDAHAYRVYSVYFLDATSTIPLNDTLKSALSNGISVVLAYDIRVVSTGGWWFDDTVASLTQRYRLRYHALSRRYLVDNLNTGISHSYLLLGEALGDIAHLRHLPLLDQSLLNKGQRYVVELKIHVETSAYPLPLRMRAIIEGAWRPSSDWYQCPLS